MNRFLSILILIFIINSNFAQTRFYGKITDSNNKPLAYANIFLNNNRIGTSSSVSGYYTFNISNIKYKYDTLIVSFLGYKTERIHVIIEGIQKQNIVLKETIENIETISILAKKPKYTAFQIIKKASKNVKSNYVNNTVIQEGFYREKLKENGITLKINECAFDLKSTAYPSPKFSKKSFHEYWNDVFNNNLEYRDFSQFSQFWPLFITTDDKVNIIESKASNECSSLDNKYSKIGDPYGGPIDIISLNNIKYKLDFFNPKLTKRYNYKIIGIKYIDSNLCYVINYERKDSLDFIYWHNYGKKVRYTLFKGEIVIRKTDFAVMSFWSESINWHNCQSVSDKKSKWYLTFFPNKIKFKLDFQETKEGLILKSVKYEANYNSVLKNTSNYKWYRELTLSIPKEKQFEENTINYFPERRRTLRERVTSYNSKFWQEFEKSDLYIPLSKQEKKDLENTMSLSKQFELINQTIAEIPKPKYQHKVDSIDIKKYLEIENDYANTVLQKLNDYERAFQPYRILQHNYDTKTDSLKKKPKYYQEMDSLRTYYIYETINDSTSKPIFNLSYESTNNNGGQIYNYDISSNYIFIDIKNIKQLPHVLKIKKKGNINTIDSIPNINEFAVVNDSLVIYSIFQNNRPSKLFLHKVGNPINQDSLLYFEHNIEYDIELSNTTSEKFIIVDITSKNQNEIWTINKTDLSFNCVYKRKNKQQIKLDHFANDNNYTSLLSSHNYKIIKTDINNLVSNTLLKSNKIIDDFYLYKNKLVYTEYEKFDMSLVLFDLEKQKAEYINPQEGFNYIKFEKDVKTKDSLKFSIESVINPVQYFKIDLNTGKYKLIDEQKYSYSSQKSNYQSEIIYVKNSDNIKIPVLIYYDKKAIKDSVTALLITAYGAYGGINVSTFDELNITLLKKGFVLAKPAVRGSAINGQDWYYDGKLLNKKNTFEDFITTTKYLKNKFNLPSKRTFAKGVSAGGLIMGVMANEYSNEFGGIILDRPFLDVYNAMKDSTKYLTSIEYQEWGNPKDSLINNYIKSYSPLQNIRKQEYTNLFFRASEFDFVTPPIQVLKQILKLREQNISNNLILLKTYKNQDHIIRYNQKSFAEEYAFMMFIINK